MTTISKRYIIIIRFIKSLEEEDNSQVIKLLTFFKKWFAKIVMFKLSTKNVLYRFELFSMTYDT